MRARSQWTTPGKDSPNRSVIPLAWREGRTRWPLDELPFGRRLPGLLKSLAVGAAVPLALFFLFEIWFLVPLPKGPVELWLGY